MKKLILILLLILMPVMAKANPANCPEFADSMIKKVIDVFHDTKTSEEQKRAVLASMFQESVDTDWIGKFVLGRFWNQSTPEQQAEYLKSYRNYVTSIYISKFKDEDGMNIDNIKVVNTKLIKDSQYETKTLLQSKDSPDVKVNYLLEEGPQKCYVHDIIVEGVSLLASERSEFSALASKAGVNGVIDAMHKQISNN